MLNEVLETLKNYLIEPLSFFSDYSVLQAMGPAGKLGADFLETMRQIVCI